MSDLVPVVRPNGQIYRPRKAPRALLVDNDVDRDPSAWVYVQGTHDIPRAYNLAARLAKRDGIAIDRETANRTWIRAAMRDGDPVFDYDPVKGAAAVSFDVVDDWPTAARGDGSGSPTEQDPNPTHKEINSGEV